MIKQDYFVLLSIAYNLHCYKVAQRQWKAQALQNQITQKGYT